MQAPRNPDLVSVLHTPRQRLMQAGPIEDRPGVGLAPRRNIRVTPDALRVDGRITGHQLTAQLGQTIVLDIGIRNMVRALKFDAHRKIIAATAPVQPGLAGMPGAPAEGHVLHQFAIPAHQRMRRNPQRRDLLKIRMRGGIKLATEEPINPGAAELPGRQTDSMHNNGINTYPGRALVTMRRRHPARILQPAGSVHLRGS